MVERAAMLIYFIGFVVVACNGFVCHFAVPWSQGRPADRRHGYVYTPLFSAFWPIVSIGYVACHLIQGAADAEK